MKKSFIILALIAALSFVGSSLLVRAQSRNTAAKFEYTIVRWEDPDRLYYNYPDGRFELVYLVKTGQKIPESASSQEYCLAQACNFLAKTGWEPLNLDSQRIVFRRSRIPD
jgi:hypothetical protein